MNTWNLTTAHWAVIGLLVLLASAIGVLTLNASIG